MAVTNPPINHTPPPPGAQPTSLAGPAAAPLSHSDLVDLDALIPPPWSKWARSIVWLALVVIAGFATSAIRGGHVYPRPISNGSPVLVADNLFLDEGEGMAGISVFVNNRSDRDLRLKEMHLDSPGTELVAIVQTPNSFNPSDLLQDALTGVVPIDPLPVLIAPGDGADFIVWVRAVDCGDRAQSWGSAAVTLDFGEGGFPWQTRTFESEPVWPGVGEFTSHPHVAEGPLALMCEVLQ